MSLGSFVLRLSIPMKWIQTAWASGRKILPRGFPKAELMGMNPADIDSCNLEIDPIDQFGTMGPTDISTDLDTYRLKITGEVNLPLSLSYEEILRLPSITEDVLLICPGFFTNHGRWKGVPLKALLDKAHLKKEANLVDIKGGREKVARIRVESIYSRKIFLAYRVNGETLPQKHGFPLRLVFEDVYGDEWVKYVDEIVARVHPQ
jgi:sulfoxide reductase catalytic subunit YedY